MSKKITVTLLCGTCGNQDFDYNEDKTWVKCNSCDREYTGGIEELKEHNYKRIESAAQDHGNKLIEQMFSDMKRKFSGSKYIKFK